ncbi:unnamed protein product [Lupinus luteus]|uniref:WAT1-related protein n=1 Tax=Lupinus luteus TaxID=3873 RepID=A0AAV1XST6_LUPLU
MEKVTKSASSKAKMIGTIVSISGAFAVTLYKGPTIIAHTPSISLHKPINTLNSEDQNWIIGGLLLTTEYTLIPLWYIVQFTWVLRIKGPVYVAMFKPLSIVIAVTLGVIFLGDTLHLGRMR